MTRRRDRGLPALVLAGFLVAWTLPPGGGAAAPAAGAALDSTALLAIVRDLADPRFEGRGVGTAGLDSAAAYLVRAMRRIGLRGGAADGGYLQPLEVTTGVVVGEPSGIRVGDVEFAVGPDFQPLGFSTNGTLRAGVVFAGYGISAPGFDYDDYAGLDVRDKFVLVLTQEPGELDSTSRFDGSINTPHAELRTKAINAREHGALGLLVVDGPRHRAGETPRPPRADGAGYMSSGLLAAHVSQGAAATLLRGSGATLLELQEAIDADERPRSVALAESATVTVTLRRTRATIHNVVGRLPGRDSTRALVLGAHYDHLGYGGGSSLHADGPAAHLGADDNASGVAVLLGVAAATRARAGAGAPPAGDLWFCAFTGEESGLLGSAHFVDAPPRPLPTISTMVNLDMVGRLRDNRLMVFGTGTALEFASLLEGVNGDAGFELKTASDGYGPSDHSSFYKRQVPVLALFTGPHADYHRPSDTWDRVHAGGLERVARFTAALVESLDARPRVTFQQAAADAPVGRIAGGGGFGAYLGTIPDYMQTEGGVLLSGVRGGSPADSAGLAAGDAIIRFDGVRVDNIYDYTYALRSRRPGQQVRITVLRDGRELDLLATLGRRN